MGDSSAELPSEDEGDDNFIIGREIDTSTALKLFQELRQSKQGVELTHLETFVGNPELLYEQSKMSWVEGYSVTTATHYCSVLNEAGERKMEGEAWCYCVGSYCRKAGW